MSRRGAGLTDQPAGAVRDSGMTRMSGSFRASRRDRARNLSDSQGDPSVARTVHGSRLVASVLLAASTVPGCVVPPPLEIEDQDAEANTPPIITEVRDATQTPLVHGQVVTVDRATPSTIELTLFDRNVDQTLFVQVFVDYDTTSGTSPPRAQCPGPAGVPPPATPSDTRTVTCPTAGLCDSADPTPRKLELEVYDAEPVGQAPYRTAPGGFKSTWTFQLVCIESV